MIKKFAATLAMALMVAAVSAAAQTAKPAPTTKPAASGEDRYIGYYYPKPTSTEVFESKLQTVAGVDRTQRIQFVTVVAQGTLQSAYRVPYAVFAKGDKGDKMIIVGMQPGEMDSIYRMRGILANMTTMSRLSPFFQEHTVAEDATFFDLLKLLGFASVTITDGEKLTHQVMIK
ncbi:MAG: molybdopterin-guanine dinucleotide biosynthesis protein A [Reyranellales bacterium]